MLRYHKKSSTFFNQVNWKKDILPQNSQKSTFWTLSMLRRLSKRVTLNVNTKPRRTKHTVTRNGSWWGRDRAAEPSAEGWNRPARVEGTGGKRACEPGDGRRWWILFYTLIYCRRYFLVGASWRLPHHRTRQWWPLDILFRIIARLAGPFYFGLYRTTPLRSAFFPDSSLSSRKLCANGAQYPLRIRRLSFHRGFTISRDRTEGFSDTGDMLDVCLFSWLRNSINLTRFRILYYKRMYVFPS